MGALNSDPTFVAIMMKIQTEWYTLIKERGFKNVASKFIVDDVLMYGCTSEKILAYFKTILDILKHHRTTLKLKR